MIYVFSLEYICENDLSASMFHSDDLIKFVKFVEIKSSQRCDCFCCC